MEKILNVFNQSYRLADKRLMEISDEEMQADPLLIKMLDRLGKATADDDLLAKMEIEEEIEETIENYIRKLENAQKTVGEQEEIIKEQEDTIKETNDALKETNDALKEKKGGDR